MDVQIQKHIVKAFGRRNLLLRPDAVAFLKDMFKQMPREEWQQKLEKLLAALPASKLAGEPMDKTKLETVAAESMILAADMEIDSRDVFTVRDAFQCPRLQLHPQSRIYIPDERPAPGIFAGPSARAAAFRGRYNVTYQRLRRHKSFAPPPPTAGLTPQAPTLKLVDVNTMKNSKESHFVLGMLTEIEEGTLYLEDPGGFVPLDWSEAISLRPARLPAPARRAPPPRAAPPRSSTEGRHSATKGFYTQNSMVIVEGQMCGKVLKALHIAMAPPEAVEESLSAFSDADFHGERPGSKEYVQLARLEEAAEDAMIVALCDVHLDRPEVMDRLRRLFEGYHGPEGEEPEVAQARVMPTAIVLMGSFLSRRCTGEHRGESATIMRQPFEELARMLSSFPRLCEETHFVFVPGSNDPGVYSILPRPAIPAYFAQPLRDVLQRAHFVSNPCRLQLFTQRIVVFREDLMLHMLRRRLPLPEQIEEEEEDNDPDYPPCVDAQGRPNTNPKRLLRTLLSQSHLYPAPTNAHPIAWPHDTSLFLYPVPEVLLLGDTYQPFHARYRECRCANPSSFSGLASDAPFYTYFPATRRWEESFLLPEGAGA
eukprot:tig00000789_g4109.t1